jgi:hypothetical protein
MRVSHTTFMLVAALAAATVAAASAAGAKPRAVRPVIGKPQATPAVAEAGSPFAVAFRVTRSDNRKALVGGKAAWAVTAGGAAVAHTSSFRGGVARVSLRVPDQAPALRIVLTVRLGSQTVSKTASFAVVPLPTVSVADVSAAEGTAAAPGKLSFPVALSKASKKTVTVAYATADGTATTPADYAAASGTLTFAPGETQKTVDVPLVGDLAVEPDETVTVKLSQPVNALLPKDTATGTITNDDVAPKPGKYDGPTTQKGSVDFVLTDDLAVTRFGMSFVLYCDQLSGPQSYALRFDGPIPIDQATGKFDYSAGNDSRSMTITGVMDAPDKAHGTAEATLVFKVGKQVYNCAGSASWNATLVP